MFSLSEADLNPTLLKIRTNTRGIYLLVRSVQYSVGKSDPYVRVGIIDATYQDEAIQKNKNLRDWQKDRRIMPTGELKESQVKAATLEPQWDEQIEL